MSEKETSLPGDENTAENQAGTETPAEPSLEEQLRQAHEERLRALAELENAKRRLEREKEDFRKFAIEAVLADLLPVLDNLDLALTHGRDIEACSGLVTGVDMTVKMFLETLARHGLEQVGKTGDDFDPAWAEAVGIAEHNAEGPDRVVQILQKGYRLKGRIIRPAKVMIAKGS
ncbi:Protein grpE [Alkalidesulfovibrio alkalitolerans DSM 16529]|jgi:molecular chaperone GrpE|uniref:Protein GrpE n=1 Tax=Alkalidesulfovibrio alkalitolerans DSM 16529 TaxID=1121439 RepID=S7UL55_9BACT|nr:nucleotide exchange factor GrpE [Alkalidesulfovibrio alkalitolerans]EPR34589.1 Protein grpE [Alkalidesulfovibrio alkalitolerans DSM 16529]